MEINMIRSSPIYTSFGLKYC